MAEQEHKEGESPNEAPQPVEHKRTWVTFILKIIWPMSDGPWGRLSVESIDGQRFQVVRWNLDEDKIKPILGKWISMLCEYKDSDFYYNRHIEIDPAIATLIKQEYKNKKAAEKLAKDESNKEKLE